VQRDLIKLTTDIETAFFRAPPREAVEAPAKSLNQGQQQS